MLGFRICWTALSSDRMYLSCTLVNPGSWFVGRYKGPLKTQVLPTQVSLFLVLLKWLVSASLPLPYFLSLPPLCLSLLLTFSVPVFLPSFPLPYPPLLSIKSTSKLCLYGIFCHLPQYGPNTLCKATKISREHCNSSWG